jgi:hypothetical protein
LLENAVDDWFCTGNNRAGSETTNQRENLMKAPQKLLNVFKRATVFALTATTFLIAVPAANAGGQVPFKAVFNTEAESTVNFPMASVHVLGEGQATHLGHTLTETTDQLVNLVTGEGTATYRFVAANGDQFRARFVFTTAPLPTQPGLSLSGTWTIIGGTGRFAGASGTGTAEGSVIFISQTLGFGHFTMTGTISSPGSLN